jgi:hypothetical protein
MARGGSKGAKKRVFKSLIAGEGATPGLERRADPLALSKGVARASTNAGVVEADSGQYQNKGPEQPNDTENIAKISGEDVSTLK